MTEDTVTRTLYRPEVGVDGPDIPGGGPEGHNLKEPRGRDRIMTSSGEAPTGGTPVGGASDRVIPGKWIRDHSTATGARDDVVGTGTDLLYATEDSAD